jgi:repressor LexA
MELHETQEKILHILTHRGDESWTRQRMMEELGLSTKSLVQHHLNQLLKKGYLRVDPNAPCGYSTYTIPKIPLIYLNMYGKARCGPDGRLLSGQPEDRLPISPKLIRGRAEDAFLVYAEGDSMWPEIQDGDLVIGLKQQEFHNGDIVIGALEGEAFIKRFRRVGDEQLLLESLHTDYDPLLVTPEAQLSLEGKYIGLVRQA